jgi:hypothetical protein
MSEPDLVEMLCLDAGLRQPQAEGVLGFLLQNLQTRLSPDAYDAVAAIIPNPEHCLECAPAPGGGLLGGLASLGGEKARLLMEMNQALNALNIPNTRARIIGECLQEFVETHHPQLLPVFKDLL